MVITTILFLYIKTCRPWSLARGCSSKISGAPVIILTGGQSLCCNQDKPQCTKTTKNPLYIIDKLSVIYQTGFRDSKNPLPKVPVSVASCGSSFGRVSARNKAANHTCHPERHACAPQKVTAANAECLGNSSNLCVCCHLTCPMMSNARPHYWWKRM